MPWTPSNRWVFPSLEIVVSETRVPDAGWVAGYRQRRYTSSLYLAIANGSWRRESFAASFWKDTGSVIVELGLGGALGAHQSDRIRLLDHPSLPLPQLGDSKQAEVFVQWSGWFEVYASADLQVSGWNEISDIDGTAVRHWVRCLDGFAAAMPRDDLEFPDFEGRPSAIWKQTAPAMPTPAPTPSPSPSPPASDLATRQRCDELQSEIEAADQEIVDLQADLAGAATAARPGLAAKIGTLTAARRTATAEAHQLGCAFALGLG